jgi:hypothetical protein
MQAAPAAVHMRRMQQPPPLQEFAAQQTCPEPPQGAPFGVVVRLDPPHDETPIQIEHNTINNLILMERLRR